MSAVACIQFASNQLPGEFFSTRHSGSGKLALMHNLTVTSILATIGFMSLSPGLATDAPNNACSVSLYVLGVAQDGGKPQIGSPDDPAWSDPTLRRHATSLALVDRRGAIPRRWLFEATPDVKTQLHMLDKIEKSPGGLLDGVFLTHAHIGHYAGLMLFGHESMGARKIPVYAMPKMAHFLETNGPWSQLVKYENIDLRQMRDGRSVAIVDDLSVTPFPVPHRQEFSEVVGYKIRTKTKSVLFIPDIDAWEDWDSEGVHIEDEIAAVDVAYLDATFFANGEIPGRDMSGFPHPFVAHSMARFADLPEAEKSKIRFIHMNHTNPLHHPESEERRRLEKNGFDVAEEGETFCLSP